MLNKNQKATFGAGCFWGVEETFRARKGVKETAVGYTLNRQGPDFGTQYRSVIFYHTQEQQKIAQKSKEAQQKKMTKKIVTVIVPAETFYPAEEYHQKYLMKRGLNVCH